MTNVDKCSLGHLMTEVDKSSLMTEVDKSILVH
jgi:hypothetical protein